VVNAALLANELGIAPQNTYRSLARLVEAGVVVEFTDRKRNQLWRSTEVLDALDRFAARAGRRTRGATLERPPLSTVPGNAGGVRHSPDGS
jgi:hypothetical protein